MHASLDEFTRLKEENTKLKQQLNAYKKGINKSIKKTDVEFILNKLIPNMAEDKFGAYEVFFERGAPRLDYLELLKVITLLLKTNREDLADFYCHHYIAEGNLDKVTEVDQVIVDEYRKILNELSKEVILKKNSTEIRLKIYFEIISYRFNKDFEPIIPELLKQYTYKLTDRIFDTQNDSWFIKMFYIISINNPKLLHEYFDYLNGHWELINNLISEEKLSTWEWLVKLANHTQMMRKVAAIKEYWDAKQNGLKNNQTSLLSNETEQSISENRNGNNKWDDYNEYSDLRRFGYKVEKGTTIEVRRNALHKAMKHIPLSKIQYFIRLRLKNSYKKNGVYGDYSNSINAYEMDLEYLQKFFHKDSSF